MTQKKMKKGKKKNSDKTEFTNSGLFNFKIFKKEIESVGKDVYDRNSLKKKLDLTNSALYNSNLRNENIAPIVNSCKNEALLRTDVEVLKKINAYCTKGQLVIKNLFIKIFLRFQKNKHVQFILININKSK